jgi:hypothetical protein
VLKKLKIPNALLANSKEVEFIFLSKFLNGLNNNE